MKSVFTGALIFLSLSCSRWGEPAPQAKPVVLEPSLSHCGSFLDTLTDPDAEAQARFQCWKNETAGIWSQVQGKTPGVYSLEELKTLIHKKVLTLSKNPQKSINRLDALFLFLSFGDSLDKSEWNQWWDFLATHLQTLRQLHTVLNNQEARWTPELIRSGSEMIQAFWELTSWEFNSTELANALSAFDIIEDKFLIRALPEIFEVTVNLLDSLCPNRVNNRRVWESKSFQECLKSAQSHFEIGIPILADHLNAVKLGERRVIVPGDFDGLLERTKAWFRKPGLDRISTPLWVTLGEALEIPPPVDFYDSLDWIRLYNKESDSKNIHPFTLVSAFRVLHYYEEHLVNEEHLYRTTFATGTCANALLPHAYEECILPEMETLRKEFPGIDWMLKTKNPKNGNQAAPLHFRTFKNATLFRALAQEILHLFDDNEDGFLSASRTEQQSEAFKVLSFGPQFVDVIWGFMKNIGHRFYGEETIPQTPFTTFKGMSLSGLSNLVTLAGDLLVLRSEKERNDLEKWLRQAAGLFPEASLHMDQLAISGSLMSIDLLSDFRKSYLGPLSPAQKHSDSNARIRWKWDDEKKNYFIHRGDLMKALPDLLMADFPRLYASCKKFGFGKSCARAIDGVLSSKVDVDGFLPIGEIDVLTFLGMGAEGVLDLCDVDSDGKLEAQMLKPSDELSCAYDHLKDLAMRLSDSKIIEIEPAVKLALSLINGLLLQKIPTKISLIRGKFSTLNMIPVYYFKRRHATLGSMMSLLGDITN